jgi:predicted MFS family arabinose efflux permease
MATAAGCALPGADAAGEKNAPPGRMSLELLLTLAPMCAWGFLDAADGSYFMGVTRALEVDIRLTMGQLQTMQSMIMVCPVFFAPFWAWVVDRRILSEEKTLALTACGWGCTSFGLAFSRGFLDLALLRCLCMAFLCASLPVTQSLVARKTHPANRGICFSLYGMAQSFGFMVSSKVATTISEQRIMGMQGWRAGLLGLGGASVTFALACLVFERAGPPEGVVTSTGARANSESGFLLAGVGEFVRIASFWVILSQCILSQFANNAFSMAPMLMQYSGLSDSETGSILLIGGLTSMAGHFVFGALADATYQLSPMHGRQIVAQLVCLCVVPVAVVIGYVLPSAPQPSFGLFCIAKSGLDFLVSGWGGAVNRPVLTMIAPEGRVSSMQACKLSIEHVFTALAITPLCLMMYNGLGYKSSHVKVAEMPEEVRQQNARALGIVFAIVGGASYALQVGCYTCLQCTMWRDLRRQGAAAWRECSAAAWRDLMKSMGDSKEECEPLLASKKV